MGGPCRYCGTVKSWERLGVGGWLQTAAQPVCHACDRDRGGPGRGRPGGPHPRRPARARGHPGAALGRAWRHPGGPLMA